MAQEEKLLHVETGEIWGGPKRWRSRGISAIDLHKQMLEALDKTRSTSFDESMLKKEETSPPPIQKSSSLDDSLLPRTKQEKKKKPQFKISPSCLFYAENPFMTELHQREWNELVEEYKNPGKPEPLTESLSEIKAEIESEKQLPKTIPKNMQQIDYKCVGCSNSMADSFDALCDECLARPPNFKEIIKKTKSKKKKKDLP